tara:strand:+ start:614 stop:838 length:225 start_codon:yes stop_codon:yes gene_type:complete
MNLRKENRYEGININTQREKIMGIMDEEPTWKYMRVPYTHEDVDIDEPDIDKLGREGWELVAVHLIKGVEIAWV